MSAQPEQGLDPVPLPGVGAVTGHDVVAVGCPAAAAPALQVLLLGLPADLPAAVLVVQTGAPVAVDALACALPVREAVDGAPLEPGAVVLAPPGRHLLVVEGRTVLATGPEEDGHRPAVDALLRSAAVEAEGRVVGVLLGGDGAGADGTAGLRAVLRHGGEAVVLAGAAPQDAALQDVAPQDAAPRVAALEDAAPLEAARRVPLEALAAVVAEVVHAPAPAAGTAAGEERARDEAEVAVSRGRAVEAPLGTPTGWTCPGCGAALLELPDAALPRYRCRAGHAWSAPGLRRAQQGEVERSLRAALAAVEQQQALDPARPEAAAHAAVLRRLLADGPGPVGLP